MTVLSDDATDGYRNGNTALFEQRREVLDDLARSASSDDVVSRRRVRRLRGTLDEITARIVEHNVGLVRSYTRRFNRMSTPAQRQEFEAAGMLGLMQAVDSYDPAAGPFGQWAFKPIQREVLRAVRHCDHPNLTPGDFEKRPAILRALHGLRSVDASYQPSDAEVAAAAGVAVTQVRRVLAPPRVESIDAAEPAGSPTAHAIASDEPSTESQVISRQLLSALRTHGLRALDARELYVIVRRFGLDGQPIETLSDIGTALSVSRETVRLVEAKAIAKLQQALVSDPATDPSSSPSQSTHRP